MTFPGQRYFSCRSLELNRPRTGGSRRVSLGCNEGSKNGLWLTTTRRIGPDAEAAESPRGSACTGRSGHSSDRRKEQVSVFAIRRLSCPTLYPCIQAASPSPRVFRYLPVLPGNSGLKLANRSHPPGDIFHACQADFAFYASKKLFVHSSMKKCTISRIRYRLNQP